jgi:hypothetical protein
MYRTCWSAILLAALIGFPVVAHADLLPPPGTEERLLAKTIQDAGYDCPEVASFAIATAPGSDDMVWGGNRPSIVTCKNGKKFLVAQPPRRRPGPPAPDNPPPPKPPAVTVRPA